eukprot:TRINITY_DN71094_c0_g1_i1.p1 TRINITY_DN71094_c0_g1~~TRINITY_DN71094_c0_g1_i1.p1  ORF type:complete len:1209 (+),score=152.35 TRINITY_DN71094_c0_g1_i1:723-4349(+)
MQIGYLNTKQRVYFEKIEELQDVIIRKGKSKEDGVTIVGIAKTPNLFVVSAKLKKETKSANEGLISKLWGLWKSPGPTPEEAEKKRPYITLKPERKLHVDYERVRQIKLDSTGTLAMISEEKGRVLLADLTHMIIIKMWKGVRECWMTFYECENMRYAIIYSLVRGLLEIYRLRHGCKVYSKYISNKLKLFDLPRPLILSGDSNKLYTIELESNYGKTINTEEYLKRMYMEQFMQQGMDAKEQSILSEIIENLQLHSEEVKQDYIKARVNQLTTCSLLQILYEKVFEVLPQEEVALWTIREVIRKLKEQVPQQYMGSGEEIETRKSMQLMEEKQRLLEIYMDAQAAAKQPLTTDTPADLYRWFIFYDHILSHTETPLAMKADDKVTMNWGKFVNKIVKNELDETIGKVIMGCLKSSDKVLVDIWTKLGLKLTLLLDWFTKWLDSMCGCTNCNYSSCELWKICKEKDNPIKGWLGAIDRLFRLEKSEKGNPIFEELLKREGPVVNESLYWKKLLDYCLTSPNFLHIVIVSNILKDIESANAVFSFGLMEKAAKFHLLVLSNVKVPDPSIEPFTFASKMSIYEFIAKTQIAGETKPSHFQREMCDLSVSQFLNQDKLEFGINLEDNFKQFGEYLKGLQIEGSYFYNGLSHSQGAGAFASYDDALKFYKDPSFLLSKLTKASGMVKFLLTLGRLWNYALKWMNGENNSLEDLAGVYNEYCYIESSPLKTAVFVKVWKKAFAPEVLRKVQAQTKGKGLSHSAEARHILDKILEIVTAFQRDVKQAKAAVKTFIKTGGTEHDKTETAIAKKIVREGYKITFSQKFADSEHKCSYCKELKSVHNSLYDPISADIKKVLYAETMKYYKHYTENTIEKEYILANPEGGEEIKEKPHYYKSEADLFYKRAGKLIELTIRILQAEQRMAGKKLEVSKKDKAAKRPTIYELLCVKEKPLLDAIWMNSNTSKSTLESARFPNITSLNFRVSFFAKYMQVDSSKAFELGKMLSVDMDNVVEYNIKELLLEGKDKEIDNYVALINNKDSLTELLINSVEERIAAFLQKQRKVDVELLQIPHVERYTKMKLGVEYKEVTKESIKRLLAITKKHATPALSGKLVVLEADVNGILVGIKQQHQISDLIVYCRMHYSIKQQRNNMLPQRQSQQLIEILSDESAKFDDSLKRFEDLFNRTEYFTVGWIVQHMIQHNVLRIMTHFNSC